MSTHTQEGRTDEAVGRAKEALGAITDDDELRHEGRADQAGGKLKQKLSEVVDDAKQAIQRVLKRGGDGERDKARDQTRG